MQYVYLYNYKCLSYSDCQCSQSILLYSPLLIISFLKFWYFVLHSSIGNGKEEEIIKIDIIRLLDCGLLPNFLH